MLQLKYQTERLRIAIERAERAEGRVEELETKLAQQDDLVQAAVGLIADQARIFGQKRLTLQLIERERVATAVWDQFKACEGERKFVLREIVKFIRDGAIE